MRDMGEPTQLTPTAGEVVFPGESRTVVPLPTTAVSAPWRPSHAGAGMLHTKGVCVHSTRTAQAQRAQRGHSTHMTGRNWGFCYNWQYSCLYKPYYTPTMLDSLMFAKAEHKNTATELGTAVTQCRQHRANR